MAQRISGEKNFMRNQFLFKTNDDMRMAWFSNFQEHAFETLEYEQLQEEIDSLC